MCEVGSLGKGSRRKFKAGIFGRHYLHGGTEGRRKDLLSVVGVTTEIRNRDLQLLANSGSYLWRRI
jgi:hypothetical protein